jgi:hypothetical protein
MSSRFILSPLRKKARHAALGARTRNTVQDTLLFTYQVTQKHAASKPPHHPGAARDSLVGRACRILAAAALPGEFAGKRFTTSPTFRLP